jgi:hypothetical protein
MEGIEAVIEQLEKQKAAIENALSALRGVGGVTAVVAGDGARRRSLAQKARSGRQRRSEDARHDDGDCIGVANSQVGFG